jgi:hypothetical protein
MDFQAKQVECLEVYAEGAVDPDFELVRRDAKLVAGVFDGNFIVKAGGGAVANCVVVESECGRWGEEDVLDVAGEVASADDAAPDEVTELAIIEAGGIWPTVTLASADQSDLETDGVKGLKVSAGRSPPGADDSFNTGVIRKPAQGLFD